MSLLIKKILSNIKNINDNLYYKKGETETINRINTAGFITSGTTSVRFMITLNKDATGLNIKVKSGQIWIRTVDGTYVANNNSILEDNTIKIQNNGKSICIQLTYNSALDMKNNTPVGIDVESLVLIFE